MMGMVVVPVDYRILQKGEGLLKERFITGMGWRSAYEIFLIF